VDCSARCDLLLERDALRLGVEAPCSEPFPPSGDPCRAGLMPAEATRRRPRESETNGTGVKFEAVRGCLVT
jgi:hypothetical protein